MNIKCFDLLLHGFFRGGLPVQKVRANIFLVVGVYKSTNYQVRIPFRTFKLNFYIPVVITLFYKILRVLCSAENLCGVKLLIMHTRRRHA